MGVLIDRFCRRNLIAAMLGIWSAACVATTFATSYLHLMVTRAVVGMSESAAGSGGLSMIADLFPPRYRPAATGIFQTAVPLGTIICFTVIAWVASEYG